MEEFKYGVFFAPHFSEFGLHREIYRKYGPEKAPYLDAFHAVLRFRTQNFGARSEALILEIKLQI